MGGKSKDMIPVNGCYSGLKPGMIRLSPLEVFTSIELMGRGKAVASSLYLSLLATRPYPRRIRPVVGKDRSARK